MARAFRAADFEYDYPPEAVAQYPLPDRGASRLLILDRRTGAVRHGRFAEFPSLIGAGDVVVRNTSRVIPARLVGTRDGGREAEILLVHPDRDGTWLALVRPADKLRAGRRVCFGPDAAAEIVAVEGAGLRRVRFSGSIGVRGVLERYGAVPLPPYIDRPPDADDRERYQTVYAEVDGSVAAPTAGLHFTDDVLAAVRARGAVVADTILHVGPGTFRPVEVDDPTAHRMHAEWYAVPERTAAQVNGARAAQRRVWAVGTTVARTLETAGRSGTVSAGEGWTDLFIFPPYEFRIVDALLTNFHLPRSTLLMLVAAFAGHGPTMAAYREAVTAGYRLFSYGDAMVIA